MDRKSLQRLINVSRGRARADLRITNCHIVDVFNKEVFDADLYVVDGLIAGYGEP